jgi:nucleoside-diphosphate-sugar epimerase
MKKALVAGAGGFIGGHLVGFLKEKGYWVRGVDIKEHEFRATGADEFLLLDLRLRENCRAATEGVDEVYQLAANMGGIGFIETVKAAVLHDNVLINTHMLEAARQNEVERYFYSSSACIYPTYKQEESDIPGLRESDAYPADPDNEYGWEKLFTERLCAAYFEDYGVETRVARFHNIYGPYGTWAGGREKAPAAICRKVAEAEESETIEIWGDGEQTRSFCYIDDCLEGVWRLTHSDHREPLNIGSDEMVTINQLVDYAAAAAGKRIVKRYDTSKPQGVRGRNSDNTLLEKVLGWRPGISLAEGIARTYPWIEGEVRKASSVTR